MNRLFAAMMLLSVVSIAGAQDPEQPPIESNSALKNLENESDGQTKPVKKKDPTGVNVQMIDEGQLIVRGNKDEVKDFAARITALGGKGSPEKAPFDLQIAHSRLTEILITREQFASEFGDAHPTVRQLDTEIEILRKLIAENAKLQISSKTKVVLFNLKHIGVDSAADILDQLEVNGVDNIVPVAQINTMIVKADDRGMEQINVLVQSIDVPAEKRKPSMLPSDAERAAAGSTDLDLGPLPLDNAALRTQYEWGERKAADLAVLLRKARAANESDQVESLSAQLREQVQSVFNLRMDIQQAELDEAEASLRAGRARLAARQQIADKIITRRVEELASGQDLSWLSREKPRLSNSLDAANTSAPSKNSLDKQIAKEHYTSYQMYLRNEIGALQHRRSDRMEDITSMEQDLVALQSDLNGQDTDVQSKLKTAVSVLSSQREALRKEVATTAAQIAQLEKSLLETRQDEPDFVAVRGEVEEVAGHRVNLSIGSDRGVELGMNMKVFRDDFFIDEIEIVGVQPESCLGILPSESDGKKVKPGDTAILLLDPRLHGIVGVDPGEPLFNEEIKRFKFRLRDGVAGVAVTGQRFMQRYLKDRGNPPIYGMWGDPSTGSIVVIAPAASEARVREFLVEGEVLATTGFDIGEDDSLEAQKERLEIERRDILRRLAIPATAHIDLESTDNPDQEELESLKQEINRWTKSIDVLNAKIQLIDDLISRSVFGGN